MQKRGVNFNIKAQIAMEYILIIALAFLIILPGIYIFRSYVFESSDRVVDTRLTEVSNLMLTKARKMYYYGPPSRTGFSADIPPQIGKMYIFYINGGNETFLVFKAMTTSGEKKYLYDSAVPLFGEQCISPPDQDCENLDYGCMCFPERFYSQGLKNFILEAKENCIYQYQGNDVYKETCILIDEISE